MAARIRSWTTTTLIGLNGLVTILAACGDVAGTDSEQVVTATFWAGIELTSKGDGRTGVKVELNESGSTGNNVRLSQNERLEVDAAGMVVVLVEDNDFADIDYEGIVDTDVFNTLFRVSLFRADGTINNGSFINIPAPFTITAPAANQAFRIGDVINVAWSPANAGSEIDFTISTACTSTGSSASQFFSVADSGTLAFDTQQLLLANENGNDTCNLDISLEREKQGTLDSSFRAGGFVHGTQIRRVEDMTIARQ